MISKIKRGLSRLMVLSQPYLPKNALGDRIHALLTFLLANRRLPKNHDSLNDLVYRMKTQGELQNPERVFTSDKELSKIYISGLLGGGFNIHTYAILKNEKEIEEYEFPSECAIKPTHSSGRAIIRKNGEFIDRGMIREWLSHSYYSETREAHYKNLNPKIIVEELVFGNSNASDIKIYCYKGEPKVITLHMDRENSHSMKAFDCDWNDLRFCWDHAKMSTESIPKPPNLEDMIVISRCLASRFELVRIDLYSDGTEVKVGEITHSPGDGRFRFKPWEAEATFNRIFFSDA